jgi:CheY-like chemotaxis protein
MNVLLVDDDPIFNMIHQKLLERTGMVTEVSSALNGEEAINLFNEYFAGTRSFPDVVLLDLNMPVMDGFSFLEAMKRIPTTKFQRTKVVVVTSSSDPRDIERANAYGVDGFFTKPISEDSLRSILA